MSNGDLNWIANYIWGIADDVLRDLYVRGKYRDVILPMTVLRRLDAVLEGSKQDVLDMKATLDDAGVVEQDFPYPAQRAGQEFATSRGPAPTPWARIVLPRWLPLARCLPYAPDAWYSPWQPEDQPRDQASTLQPLVLQTTDDVNPGRAIPPASWRWRRTLARRWRRLWDSSAN